jgi:hypothetical protein
MVFARSPAAIGQKYQRLPNGARAKPSNFAARTGTPEMRAKPQSDRDFCYALGRR